MSETSGRCRLEMTAAYKARGFVQPVFRAILARAGSPPVVEVPAISRRDVPMQNEAFAYRAALDKAGVKWKEVGRE